MYCSKCRFNYDYNDRVRVDVDTKTVNCYMCNTQLVDLENYIVNYYSKEDIQLYYDCSTNFDLFLSLLNRNYSTEKLSDSNVLINIDGVYIESVIEPYILWLLYFSKKRYTICVICDDNNTLNFMINNIRNMYNILPDTLKYVYLDIYPSMINISNNSVHFYVIKQIPQALRGRGIDKLITVNTHLFNNNLTNEMVISIFPMMMSNKSSNNIIMVGDNKVESLFKTLWDFKPLLNHNFELIDG